MKRHNRSTKKYLLLVSVLMLMLVLCGCRTRLTNNTEVSSTITDEDGTLTETYEMRRDELGSPVAPRPVFTGWGSSDDDYDYGDEGQLEDYDPYADDGWVEPDDDSGDVSGDDDTTTAGSTTKRNNTPVRPGNKKKDSDSITITLNLNDGEGTKNTITTKKDTVYGDFLPTEALREGYVFVEWTTDKKNKKPVDLKAKATSNQTLYAHWKKAEEKPAEKPAENPDRTIKWEYDSDVTVADADKLPTTIKDGEKYPDPMPSAHKKNYHFTGWYDGSSMVAPGSVCTGDSRLVAKFDSWEKTYNDAKPADTELMTYIADKEELKYDLGNLPRGNAWSKEEYPDNGPDYIIIRLDEDDFTKAAAKALAEAKRAESEDYANSVIIVVPKDAEKGNNELYYKLLIHNTMYGGLDLTDADKDTEAKTNSYYVNPES